MLFNHYGGIISYTLFFAGKQPRARQSFCVVYPVKLQINRQAGVNGIGKYCGQYGLSKGNKSFRMVTSSCC